MLLSIALLRILSLVAGASAAPVSVTGGAAVGLVSTPETNPLGDGPTEVIRLGVRLVDYFDIEGEVGRVEGKTRDLRVVYHLYNPRGSVLFHVTPNARADLFFGIINRKPCLNICIANQLFNRSGYRANLARKRFSNV